MTFTLLWWHLPVILLVVGWLMMIAGARMTYNIEGGVRWPDSETTGFGFVGGLLIVIGITLLFGGCYRGLFV